MRRVFWKIMAAFFCVAFLLVSYSSAWARIDITPTRVLIDSRERSGEVVILNLLDKPGTIRMGIIAYRQKPDGSYELLDGPLDPQFDPAKYVRLSPRQFTLPPKGRQNVRISVRRPADLPDGVYRFHVKALRFANEDESTLSGEAGGPQVRLYTNNGIAIPVVVNQGKVEAGAKISNTSLVRGKSGNPELHLRINRSGNGAIFGSLKVFWDPAGGTSRKIGASENLNIFHEIDYRDMIVPLQELPGGAGRIRVIYNDDLTRKTLDEVVLEK